MAFFVVALTPGRLVRSMLRPYGGICRRVLRFARKMDSESGSFCGALAEHGGEKGARVDAMGGVVRAGVDAAWFLQVRAEIAGRGFLFDDGFLVSWVLGIGGENLKWMQIDVAVRAIARAEAAADAPVFDDDFERIAAADRADRAADHAERIAALAATRGDEILVEAQTVADETRDAVVCIGAGVHTGVAARAILQIQNQQALRFHQSLREELIDGDVVNHLHSLLIGGATFGGNGFETGSNAGETRNHIAEIVAGDSNEFDVIESGASGGSNAAAEEADFAEVVSPREIRENHLAAGIIL